jgi:hypothetical protein
VTQNDWEKETQRLPEAFLDLRSIDDALTPTALEPRCRNVGILDDGQ